MAEFFLVVAPGLEQELVEELHELEGVVLAPDARPALAPWQKIETVRGGVALTSEPLPALQLHYFSRLTSRVLLRIKTFRATEFYQLEKNLRTFEWARWLGEEKATVKAEATKSRLGHEKRILEVAHRVWPHSAAEGSQTIFLRNESDEFTLSLDLTGEHLHRRHSGRELGGPAPIRETLAAGLVRFLRDGAGVTETRQISLVDPLAGSGTLLSEASEALHPLATREFAFQKQPWIPKILKSPSFLANFKGLPREMWRELIAIDQSAPARDRLAALQNSLSHPFRVIEPGQDWGAGPFWVVSNPPYGERLAALAPGDLRDLLLRGGPVRVAVILPEARARELAGVWPGGWRVDSLTVANGGLACSFLRFVKKF